ncbi:HAMP domain-containing sensor histidine kinase [Hoeflea sp. YIM 152468]|uniref:sensor histidine kinase n=1 Tax=Hoeflea sp. YIM 152468 TaxID=3031759 RepID=UPI0023D9E343|nr:HAMP domain-containing sensor histidine kinase [Hoeflea sp. YIM 152468]MDF1607296.1 HAMP domain-containing sensor histidine kinase [Hoeflea sp. YIM 152468]
MTNLDDLIAKMQLAGRHTAESWLGTLGQGTAAYESRLGAMTACLSSAVIAPVLTAPVLLMLFAWPHAVAGALAATAIPISVAGVLSATGSTRLTGRAALAAVSIALAGLAGLSGGLASPLLVLLALLPLESAIQSKRPSGLLFGLAAAAAAILGLAVWQAIAAPASVPDGAQSATAIGLALYAVIRGMAFCLKSDATGPTMGSDPGETADLQAGDVLERLPGLVTLHTAHGDVVRVAGADQGEFMRSIGDLSGKGFVRHIHVADRIAFLDAVDSLRRGAERAQVELRFDCIGQASQFVHAVVFLSAERGADGGLLGILAQTRDVSRNVASQTDANAAAEEAETANADKTRFLAAVSHELRTPLNAIIGFSDILACEMFGTFSDERQREYVGLIHQSGQHLLTLVNTMLDMSKIEAGRYEVFVEPFPIGEVIDSCDAMLRLQAANRGVTLTRRLARGTGEVVADRGAVQQILINLVGNAIKFTEAGGVVNVDAAISDDRLKLVVSDTGIGIPADKLATIADPFVQVQNGLGRSYEGTGLGLSLVKGLVALHGGNLILESVEGAGTVVTIDLPVDGSGANCGLDQATPGPALAFPPVLPRPARSLNGIAAGSPARHDEKIRNEDYAETARIA